MKKRAPVKKARRESRGCCGPTKIASKLRFDPKSAIDLSPAEIEFGKAMVDYMATFRGSVRLSIERGRTVPRLTPTCGEVCDVAMNLGYHPPVRDFQKAVQTFTQALHQYKKRRGRPIPMWSEVLEVLTELGWTKAPQTPVT